MKRASSLSKPVEPEAPTQVRLQVGEIVPLDQLRPLLPEDKNHNVLSHFRFDGLKEDIIKYGFDEPMQVWKDPAGVSWIVNGHKRYAALLACKSPVGLVVYKEFESRNAALAYSIRRNQERGQNDLDVLAQTIKELEPYDTLEDMQTALTLTERELFDLTEIDRDIMLPATKREKREAEERTVVKVQLSITAETKAALDKAMKHALRGLSEAEREALPLPHSYALEAIVKAYLDKPVV